MRERIRLQTPPIERTEQVAKPAIPAPSIPCGHDPAKLCNTDADTGAVLSGYDSALAEANRRLSWLGEWIRGAGGKKKKR